MNTCPAPLPIYRRITPMPKATMTIAALLLGLSTTTSAYASPESASPAFASTDQSEFTAQLMAVDQAVQATREDPSALCFVITLPDNYKEARAIRDLWIDAQTLFDSSEHQVFFVHGHDAEFVLESAYISTPTAAIAYRNGRPYHSRTGTFTEENLHAFLALSFDNSAPTTAAPDQTAFLYNSMNKLAQENQDADAAKGACSIMLNLHALIHGPYAISYPAHDLAQMTDLYNQTQFTLASLDISDDAVAEQIASTRSMAMKTWNVRTGSTFGIGIWMDLALISGNESEILDWIDEGLSSPSNSKRVAQSLADYGQSIAQLLIDTHHYEALAMTITSPDQIADQLSEVAALASTITDTGNELSPSYQQHIQHATDRAAAYHAALLLSGRDSEAWQVAKIIEDFAGPAVASVSICSAAINAGTLTDRHAFFVRNIDQSQHPMLIDAMNTGFAVVPTDD